MSISRRAQFGDLERAILEVLWGESQDPRDPNEWLSVRDIHTELSQARAVAYTTVMTVLDRLAAKQIVERCKMGRAFHYRCVHSRHEMTVELMHSVLGEFSADARDLTLLAFVRGASTTDREAIRAALEQMDGEVG
ncbi:MAG TPA: BlaI/MecI/CopY family transcriptional regulator [Marmoricola sp.]|nr:BlaI/MecI/CopY family transcriptional regulator [Marmoricola sp.]HNI71103.1 BlaI/MecI/CopY family transcriptional regulator [Marmoricola sp.]HNJ78571.1 BlaI/MecI/CopY family transcriptional regulator [Marmoricola sp.]HNN47916.1 BlaI/MecI/CopY family transcriptional regulator [Marmoricola sp.]HNO39924.1 BlaI/MecI/CopY family transcriptional regulator [Marmoricola sp.]